MVGYESVGSSTWLVRCVGAECPRARGRQVGKNIKGMAHGNSTAGHRHYTCAPNRRVCPISARKSSLSNDRSGQGTNKATINCLILSKLTPKIPVEPGHALMIEQVDVKIYLTLIEVTYSSI
jgi:hypothetical protein